MKGKEYMSRIEDVITNYLVDKLSYAYCDNCNNQDEPENCDECHRKYQNWCLSEKTARVMAVKIEELVEELIAEELMDVGLD